MILVIVFMILFTWAVSRGINSGAMLGASSELKKPQIEYVVKVQRKAELDGKTLNLIDYLNEKKKRDEFEKKFGNVTRN